jgi:hypothetical protein
MPFEADDVYVGMIAWFTVRDLRRQPRVRMSGNTSDCNKPRPFVCYAQDDIGDVYWTHFTGTWNPQRRTVSRRWLRVPPGCTAFLAMPGDLLVGDGRNAFVGPPDAFAPCSRRHDSFEGIRRPVLLAEGVDEVRAIVRGKGGLMPPAKYAVPLHTSRAA